MVLERIESLHSIKKGYFVIFLLIAIDLVAKYLAEEYLSFGQAVPLIPILDLLLVFNSGIAFSILDFNNSFLSLSLSLIGIDYSSLSPLAIYKRRILNQSLFASFNYLGCTWKYSG